MGDSAGHKESKDNQPANNKSNKQAKSEARHYYPAPT